MIMVAVASSATISHAKEGNVTFLVSKGLEANQKLKKKINMQTSRLLTLFNKSYEADLRSLDFDGIDINEEAKATMRSLWKYNIIHTAGDDSFPTIESSCLKTPDGEYEVRNLVMMFTPTDGSTESERQEVAIQFDPTGKITGFNMTLDSQQYSKILEGMSGVNDEFQRARIIKWMEQMCTAYNERDIAWFETFFSDDVVVITGKRSYKTVKGKNDVRLKKEYFEYVKKNKAQYLASLRKVFANNRKIKVSFGDDFKIQGHRMSERYYAVEVTQYFRSSSYSDTGRLFVVWDFGMDEPQILLRAWTELDDNRHFGFGDVEGLRF